VVDVVGEVVAVVVGEVDGDVVGVVTWQSRNAPRWNASTIALSVAAVASQSDASTGYRPNAHSTVSPLPAGPLCSRTTALMAAADRAQAAASASTAAPSTMSLLHDMLPAGVGHVASARFRTPTCASQLYLLSTASSRGTDETQ
jgi:hypothetical protein